MTVYDYQERALETAKYYTKEEQFLAGVLGISAEAGEVSGKIEKRVRKGMPPMPNSQEEKMALLHELGDVMWFVSATLDALDYTMTGCMMMNLEKLRDRELRNVIHGDGDNR